MRVKGSFTVEATFVLWVTLELLVVLVYLGLYWYNTATCTYMCYETGRALLTEQEGVTLESQKARLRRQLIGVQQLEMSKETKDNGVGIAIKAKMQIPLVGKTVSIYEEQWAYRLDQRAFILRCRSVYDRFLGQNIP